MYDEMESDYEASTPRKMHRANYMLESSSSGEDAAAAGAGNTLSPATPPLYNHTNSSRRKGVPHRAPF